MHTIDTHKKQNITVQRDEIWFADLHDAKGSEQGGIRPFYIVQNNTGNKHAPTVTGIPISSQIHKAKLPTHVLLSKDKSGLEQDSFLMCEQLRTIDKTFLENKVVKLDNSFRELIENALIVQLDLTGRFRRETAMA